MNIIVNNVNFSLIISLTALRLVGFWAPDDFKGNYELIYKYYGFLSFTFYVGNFLTQAVDLFVIWGNIPLMTATLFLLGTNLAHATKFINLYLKRKLIKMIVDSSDDVLRSVKNEEAVAIVKSCNRQTKIQLLTYLTLTYVTIVGLMSSAEHGSLPLRAWYPYDTTKSPAYELTFGLQVYIVCVTAFLNVSKDTMVTTMIAQCHCRLKLIGLSLKSLCQDLHDDKSMSLSPNQEKIARARLRDCAIQHQTVLEAAVLLQNCFSAPTFAQFNVSLLIICVTAFQLVSQTGNMVRLLSMGTYLTNMTFQVFIYCYQGNQLSTESSEISTAAYLCPWYLMSPRLRRDLLIVMTRSRRIAKITAGGFTTLSLSSFMAIIKASYSLFTLLKQVDEKNLNHGL
ncbi:odorant receptor Or1 isoform X1 [Galleria mellonella]|uniref:Odorant receptor n=1 Tax=Galleria mellonella TaxID=7137 RepID=A0ABM3N3R9_GALME|nr:odorant receptor Or1 isoform X1 [Galleria mellonella]